MSDDCTGNHVDLYFRKDFSISDLTPIYLNRYDFVKFFIVVQVQYNIVSISPPPLAPPQPPLPPTLNPTPIGFILGSFIHALIV